MNPASFKQRRERFFKSIEGGVAIVPSATEVLRNDDVHYRFRQDSSFYYLTGFDEPDSYAVFRNVGGKQEYILFVRPRDKDKEIWDGRRAGVDGAVSIYGADRAFTSSEFLSKAGELLKDAETVYYTLRTRTEDVVLKLLDEYRRSIGRSGRGLLPVRDAREIIGEMRIKKSSEELAHLHRAGEISARAHKEAMCRARPGLNEYQIEALIEYCFREQGAGRVGYSSIVASGHNATVLHYVENNKILAQGDLLLIDAGAEYEYLTADITRTFPVNGKFSPEAKEIYNVVLQAQQACLAMSKPGATLAAIHQCAVEHLTQAMIDLGFLTGARDDLIKSLAYKRFYPHGTGHLLGMDVHDIGLYVVGGKPRPLEEGMVFTIEPGFYVQPDDTTVPERYRGIGVRIEDDIALTATGHEVLTAGVPKEVADIEAIVGSKPWESLL